MLIFNNTQIHKSQLSTEHWYSKCKVSNKQSS